MIATFRLTYHAHTYCTGTMLFGESTAAADAERLMSLSVDQGINCFDTAEMYPVPQSAATQVQ